jgi:uncharacterized SAM-binding protein YcdF (DUF218 family)
VRFWLLSTEPVRDVLIHPLEFRYPVLQVNNINKDKSAIVLLGGGVYENAPEYEGEDALTSYALMRTIYAADIAVRTGLNVYATGGKPFRDDIDAEGDVMVRWLMRFGVAAKQAHAENLANNTWENAVYIHKILNKKGINNIILVTTAWHMPRSIWCFQAQGFTVIPAGVDYLTATHHYDLRSFFPSGLVFAQSSQALHEYLGMFWYQLRYGK